MAQETEKNVTAWRKVVNMVELEDTGNILTPLQRMYEHYVSKACKLYQQATENPEKRANIIKNADYYKRAAENLLTVINQ
jgi:hypothetical protein